MAHPSPLIGQFCLVLGTLACAVVPDELVPAALLQVRETLRNDELNDVDYERMERGYYERLLDAGHRLDTPAGSSIGRAHSPASAVPVPFDFGPLAEPVDDVREFVLRRGQSVDLGTTRWSTNALGMRDRDHALAKPAGCMRIAIVGDSIGAGWGVDDGQSFGPALEHSLNDSLRSVHGSAGPTPESPTTEVLNFAVPGYAPGQRWYHFTQIGWEHSPDLVIYEATLADPGWDERRLRALLPRGIGLDVPVYHDALARIGVPIGKGPEWYKQALRLARWDILENVYRTIANDCHARGVPVIWVLIPRVGKTAEPAARARLLELARRSGFSAVADISNAFEGIDPAALAISPSDYHPNARGHTLLAQRLEAMLKDLSFGRVLMAEPQPIKQETHATESATGAEPR